MTAGVGTLFPIVRGLISVTILVLIGTLVAQRIATRSIGGRDTAVDAHIEGWLSRLPGLLAWFLLTLSLGRGTLQVLSFTEPGQPIDRELVSALLLGGGWGTAWLMQTLAALVLLAGSWLLRARRREAGWLGLTCVGVIVWAQSGLGHGVDEVWAGALGRLVSVLHQSGGGLWLGTLAVLAVVVFPVLRIDGRIALLASVVRDFSVPARIGAALLVGSGIAATWVYVGSLGGLIGTTYGRLVLAKILLLAITAALGWWNWRVVTPALAGAESIAPARLRRAVVLELAIGVVILAVTAVLAGTPMPTDE